MPHVRPSVPDVREEGVTRVAYGVFSRGEHLRTFSSRRDAEDYVRLCAPGCTIETLTFTRR